MVTLGNYGSHSHGHESGPRPECAVCPKALDVYDDAARRLTHARNVLLLWMLVIVLVFLTSVLSEWLRAVSPPPPEPAAGVYWVPPDQVLSLEQEPNRP